ncbi:hypothetical protein [Kordia sp.]|uniref:hypothetical protein n=1 Tax=Kordia sp. TaxID=1965332 RepID=UPI003D6AAE33
MNEYLKSPETITKSSSDNRPKQNFRKNKVKVLEIRKAEEEERLTDFLEENQITNSESSRQKLKQLLQERQSFDENFSLEDFSEDEIISLKSDSEKEKWKINKSEAKATEAFVDKWEDEGFSQYEILQKLLKAHETKKIVLLPEKHQQFEAFLDLIQNNSFAEDTTTIITVINQSNIDLSSPKAMNQIVFAIFEDETISEATKIKLGKYFNLKPILTGDDLRDNLLVKQAQILKRKQQQIQLDKSLDILEEQTVVTKDRLRELKTALLMEIDEEKRQELQKRYDELEELLERLEKDAKFKQEEKQQLINQVISDTIFIQGISAELQSGKIILTIPDSETKVSVPDHFDSKDIAKVVNAHLMYNLYETFGLESFLFYPSDFIGDYPTQMTLDRNNAFLHKLGVSYDSSILKKSEINKLQKLFESLMLSNFYNSNLTLKENATNRLLELEVFTNRELNHQKLTKKLLWVKQFGKTQVKNVV